MEALLVTPGELLGEENCYASGEGTYRLNGKIYASVRGECKAIVSEEKKIKILEVKALHLASKECLQENAKIIGRIHKVMMKQVMIHILMVNGVLVNDLFYGVLRKEDVQMHEIDQLDLMKMFQPGQLIQAIIRSYMDGKTYYLSTAKDGLGIINRLEKLTMK